MPPKCQCSLPSDQTKLYCERHRFWKNRRLVELCNLGARGEAPGLAYWQQWEKTLEPRKMAVQKKIKPQYISGIGDVIAARFEALGIVPVPGCPCKEVQRALNAVPPAAVRSDLVGWAKKLQRSARKWKELKGGIWNIIPTPPLMLCQKVIEDAIKIVEERDTTC